MEEEILNYFNNTANGKFIRALDNNYKKYYTGVTLRYITYKVLKAKYKKSEVAECLLNLHKTSQIKGLFCSDIKQYVLEPLLSNHGNFSSVTGDAKWGYSGSNLHRHLEKFIK